MIYLDYIIIIGIIAFLGLCVCLVAYTFPIRGATHIVQAKAINQSSTLSEVTFSQIQTKKAMLTPSTPINLAPIDVNPTSAPITLTNVNPKPFIDTTIQLTNVEPTQEIPNKIMSSLEFHEMVIKKRGPSSHVKHIHPRVLHVDPYIKPSRKFDDHHNYPWKHHATKNTKSATREHIEPVVQFHDSMDDIDEWLDLL